MQFKQLTILTVLFAALFAVAVADRPLDPVPDEAVGYGIPGQSCCDRTASRRIFVVTWWAFSDDLDE